VLLPVALLLYPLLLPRDQGLTG